jgi:multidrug transporter EmrE-like cation transporter
MGLVALLCCGGLTDFTSKIYEEMGSAALSDHYLLYTFAAACVLCAALAAVKKQRLTAKDAVFGALVGIPNYYSARFLLAALGSVPAVIAYPTVNVGVIVAVSLFGLLLFKERLGKRQWMAMGVILVALVLLNV